MRGIHRPPVNSPHKSQWRGALMFSLICVLVNGWENNRKAGDLRRYRAHYDVIVIQTTQTHNNDLPWRRFSHCGVFFNRNYRYRFGGFFVFNLTYLLNNQSICRWLEKPNRSCDVIVATSSEGSCIFFSLVMKSHEAWISGNNPIQLRLSKTGCKVNVMIWKRFPHHAPVKHVKWKPIDQWRIYLKWGK